MLLTFYSPDLYASKGLACASLVSVHRSGIKNVTFFGSLERNPIFMGEAIHSRSAFWIKRICLPPMFAALIMDSLTCCCNIIVWLYSNTWFICITNLHPNLPLAPRMDHHWSPPPNQSWWWNNYLIIYNESSCASHLLSGCFDMSPRLKSRS